MIDAQFMDNTKILSKQGIISFVGNIVEIILKYLYCFILAKSLGAKLVGVYFLGFTILSIVQLIGKLELQEGVLKFVSAFRSAKEELNSQKTMFLALKIVGICSILLCIILLFLAKPLAIGIFKEPLLKNVLIIFMFSVPFFNLTTIVLSYFQAHLRMKYVILIRAIFQPLINILIFFLFLALGDKLQGAAFSYLFSLVLALMLTAYILKNKFRLTRIEKNFSSHDYKFVWFCLPILFASILNFAMQWIDTLMLGYFRNASEVGVYGVALRIAALGPIFLAAFATVFAPMISGLHSDKRINELELLFKFITKWILTLSLPFLLLLLFFSHDLLTLFGNEFLLGKDALVILIIGQIINVITGPVYYMLIMSGRSRVALFNSLVFCFIGIILNLTLIPKYGILGAAIANAVSVALSNLIMLVQVYGFLKIHPYEWKFIKPISAALVSIYILFVINKISLKFSVSIPALFISILFIIFYASFLWKFGFDKNERRIFTLVKDKLLSLNLIG